MPHRQADYRFAAFEQELVIFDQTAGGLLFLACCIKLFFAEAPNMGHVAELGARCFARRIVIVFVQAQMLRFLFRQLGPLDHDGI